MIFEATCTTHRASRVQQRRSLNAIITNNQRGTVKNLRKQYGGNTTAIVAERPESVSTDAVDTEKIIKPANFNIRLSYTYVCRYYRRRNTCVFEVSSLHHERSP